MSTIESLMTDHVAFDPEVVAKQPMQLRQFARSAMVRAKTALGQNMKVNMGNTAIREGVICTLELVGFEWTASGKTAVLVWKIGQAIPKTDGTGYVLRHATVRRLPMDPA